jgi:hypothetical protein
MTTATQTLFNAFDVAATAARRGDMPAVRRALATVRQALHAGADANAEYAFGLRPLHLACRFHATLAKRYFVRCPALTESIISLLLERGADPLARDHYNGQIAGMTASGMMPAAWCEGHTPDCLRQRMAELTAVGTWPEPNPGRYYDEDEVQPERATRKWNFVPRARCA